jgi:hypothetical protein
VASDSFEYNVCNTGTGACAGAVVWVTVDRAPVFGAGVDGSIVSIVVGGALPGPVSFSDPDPGDSATLSVSGTLPDGLTLGADGVWAGSTDSASPASYPITVTACDGHGICATAALTVVVSAAGATDPPAPGPTVTSGSTPPPTVSETPRHDDGGNGMWLIMAALALALAGIMAGWSRMETRGPRR